MRDFIYSKESFSLNNARDMIGAYYKYKRFLLCVDVSDCHNESKM